MISITHSGNFNSTEKFLKKCAEKAYLHNIERYGKMGVEILASATPVDSGKTADSWNYEIHRSKNSVKIVWTNSNIVDGVPVAILLQYGHATRNGGYVEGIDYINPALRTTFEKIAEDVWKEVTNS